MVFKIFDDIDEDDFYQGGSDSEPELDPENKNDPRNKYSEDMEKFDTGLSDGIQRSRCCTDIICLVIFIAFVCSMGYATVYGYKNGQVNKLTAPLDGVDNFCGFDQMEGYPKMIFTKFLGNYKEILGSGVCVKECPRDGNTPLTEGVNCKSNTKISCSDRAPYVTYDLVDYCIPTGHASLSEEEKKGVKLVLEAFQQSGTGKIFMDLYNSSTAIYICFGLSFVWSIIFIYIMSMFAETLAKCCVVLIQLGLIGMSVLSFFAFQKAGKERDVAMIAANYDALSEDQKKEFDSENKGPTFYLMLLITFSILSIVFFCMICCGRKSLQRAIDVIDASADFIAHNKRVIAVPILHFFLTLLVVIIWFGAYICVASLNEIQPSSLSPQVKDLVWTKQNWYLGLYMFFGLLWLTAFVDYCSRFIVIVSATTYYFNNSREHTDQEASAEICYGFKCAYVHHPGSIAMGSFIIALIRFIKFVFYYMAKKAEAMGGQNPAVKCLINCGKCYLSCIEKICDYLNEAAFCYMAVTGNSFLSSAWNGFLLNLKHGLKFTFANMIAKVFIFVGKIGIVVGNCFTLQFIMTYVTKDTAEVSSPWGPIIMVGFVTYLAASLFLSLFEEAVMALLTSLCVDLDMNKGEPKFGPATFHDDYLAKVKGKKSNSVE